MLFKSSYLRARLEEMEFVCMCFEPMRNLERVLGVGTQLCFPQPCVGKERCKHSKLSCRSVDVCAGATQKM